MKSHFQFYWDLLENYYSTESAVDDIEKDTFTTVFMKRAALQHIEKDYALLFTLVDTAVDPVTALHQLNERLDQIRTKILLINKQYESLKNRKFP